MSALQAGWRWCLGLYDRKVETTLGSRLSEWLSRLLLVPDQQRAWHVRGLHLWLVPAGQQAAVLTRVEWLTAQTMQFPCGSEVQLDDPDTLVSTVEPATDSTAHLGAANFLGSHWEYLLEALKGGAHAIPAPTRSEGVIK